MGAITHDHQPEVKPDPAKVVKRLWQRSATGAF
jgi:hypothetical protein